MINELAHKAVELLLAGDDSTLAALRIQYQQSCVHSIELTGVGAYINYEIPESAINLPDSLSFCFGDIEGNVKPLKHGVGFLLWIKNGKLSFLEIYTYDEPWPSEIEEISLGYIGGKRNFEELRKTWS